MSACTWLGRYYLGVVPALRGTDYPETAAIGMRILEAACAKHDPEACAGVATGLHTLLWAGYPIPYDANIEQLDRTACDQGEFGACTDPTIARPLAEKACAAGNVAGCLAVKDVARSMELIGQACAQHRARTCAEADSYDLQSLGASTPPATRDRNAFEQRRRAYVEAACAAGASQACHDMGNDARACDLGDFASCTTDERACDAGSNHACAKLGDAAAGTDRAKALLLYERACEAGSVHGCEAAGDLDSARKLDWFTKACDAEYEDAASARPICSELSGLVGDPVKRRELRKQGCERGEFGACECVAPSATASTSPDRSTNACPPDMVHVAGAAFCMGSPAGTGERNEHPQHEVTLSGYCIDKTEVTVAAYAACVKKGSCSPATPLNPAEPGERDRTNKLNHLCNGARADRRDHPVNCIDWNQAETYCKWAGKRLPTEAEWEYAARGSVEGMYPWGNDPPTSKRLNACGSECYALLKRMGLAQPWPSLMYDDSDGWESTAPVGSYRAGASPFGALDMAGNVEEWTADNYGSYHADAVTNPTGPASGLERVVRGGGWADSAATAVRGAGRGLKRADERDVDLGFRCARGE